MGIIFKAVAEYAKTHSLEETDFLARKLLGLDADEDTGWRTAENGKHYHINKKGDVDKGPNVMKGHNINESGDWGKSSGKAVKSSGSSVKSAGKPAAPKRRPKDSDGMVEMVTGKGSYTQSDEYRKCRQSYSDAMKKQQQLKAEWRDLSEKAEKELIPVPGMGRQYWAFMGSYTEKGKELAKQEKEAYRKLEAAESETKQYSDRMEKMKREASRKQKEKWNDTPLKDASQEKYEGFRTDTTGVPYLDEKLKNGQARVVEMSPKEYLERCAYQIFDNATIESVVNGTNPDDVGKYADKMESGTDFDMPYLNFSSSNQEGRHRALAAMMNGIEKIPVAVVGTPETKETSPEPFDTEAPDFSDTELPDDLPLEPVESMAEPVETYPTMQEAPADYDNLVETEEPFDIFEWLSQQPEETEEEKAERRRKEKEAEREERERNDYGQNGLNEKDYPEDLRLTDKDREAIFDIYRGYKDPAHKTKASTDVMMALNGMATPERLDEMEKQYTEILEAATEMISQRKKEGYSFKNTVWGQMKGKERKQAWWDYFNEHGVPPEGVGEKGIRYWQTARKDALKKIGDLGLAKKIAKRFEFAKKQPGFVPWRKNENSSNPRYRPWERGNDAAPVMDEEIWRTNEEGEHFKLESTTGEIKAGFGGKFNGKKIGETWRKTSESTGGSSNSSGGAGKQNSPEHKPQGPAKKSSGMQAAEYSNLKKNAVFSSIASKAKNAKNYDSFVAGLTQAQQSAIAEQHQSLKTDESLKDYTERLRMMLAANPEIAWPKNQVVQGKDITDDFNPDFKPYTNPKNGQVIDTEIEHVIHTQGFDGVPKVVSQDEFNKILEDHPEMPILLRTYSAPNQEALAAYNDMLEHGEWYVDCGVGGAQYGQGMYTAGAYNINPDRFDKLTDNDLERPGVLFSALNNKTYKLMQKEPHMPDSGFLMIQTPYLVKDKNGEMHLVRLNDADFELEDAETGKLIENPDSLIGEAQGVWQCLEGRETGRAGGLANAKREMDDYIALNYRRAFQKYKDDGIYDLPEGMRLVQCGPVVYELKDLNESHAFYCDPQKGKTFEEQMPEVGERIAYYSMDKGTPKGNLSVWEMRDDGRLHLVDGLHTNGFGNPDNPEVTIDPNNPDDDSWFDKSHDKWYPIEGSCRQKPFETAATIRAMTLDPSAKIISYRDLTAIMDGSLTPEEEARIQRRVREENPGMSSEMLDAKIESAISEAQREREIQAMSFTKFGDEGSLAAALGYDAINAEGHGKSSSYTIVLNRTKVILSDQPVEN